MLYYLVHCCNKGFLITFGQLRINQPSACRSKYLPDLLSALSQVTKRGAAMVLYLLVVAENGYELLPREG
jgi:hypothetical protein